MQRILAWTRAKLPFIREKEAHKGMCNNAARCTLDPQNLKKVWVKA